jgi:HK97 family phage major capsid protein
MSTTEVQNKVGEVAQLFEEFKHANDKRITDTADNLNKAITKAQEQIEAIKLSMIESKAMDAAGEALEKAKWLAEDKKTFKKWMLRGEPGVAFARSSEAMQLKATVGNETTGADGGFGVPTVIQEQVDLILKETSPVEKLTPAVTIGTEVYTKLLNNNDASASWGGEVSASGTTLRTQTNANTYTRIQITPQILYANPQLSLEMIEDVQFDAVQQLIKSLSDLLLRTRNSAFVNGSGAASNQPTGFMNTTAYTVNALTGSAVPAVGNINTVASGGAAGTGKIVSDDIYNLIYAMIPQYRANGVFSMHRLFLEQVRELKDNYGRYLWQPSVIAGQPSMLAGYPVVEFDDMPAVATATTGAVTYPIVFADWEEYYRVVNRVGLQMLRDPYSVEGAIVYKTRQRVGGGIENGAAGVTLAYTY